jgi:protein-ribulosamine 3-kinase
MYPDHIKTQVQDHFGHKIQHSSMLAGGSIASSWRLDLENGLSYVLKINPKKEMVQAEADGLNELAKSGEVRIPEVCLYEGDWLVLEFIASGTKDPNFFSKFGRQLAKMHRHESGSFGFERDNFIGETPQLNTEHRHSWVDFFWENRLHYQVDLAMRKGAPHKLLDTFHSIESVAKEHLNQSLERPCLIHGDLWSGNFLVDSDQKPVLIDPAVYYGHRETELAMTKLFGGFDPNFYRAYEEEYPLQEGYQERLPLYELYHVLNHYNLFGGHYLDQSLELMGKYL